MSKENLVKITVDNFEEEVIKASGPVLVDFWAQWCGPCRAITTIMEELADEFDGQAKIAKVNVDEVSELAQKYKIMSIPTLMLFKDGEIVEKIIGVRSKDDFKKLILKNI